MQIKRTKYDNHAEKHEHMLKRENLVEEYAFLKGLRIKNHTWHKNIHHKHNKCIIHGIIIGNPHEYSQSLLLTCISKTP